MNTVNQLGYVGKQRAQTYLKHEKENRVLVYLSGLGIQKCRELAQERVDDAVENNHTTKFMDDPKQVFYYSFIGKVAELAFAIYMGAPDPLAVISRQNQIDTDSDVLGYQVRGVQGDNHKLLFRRERDRADQVFVAVSVEAVLDPQAPMYEVWIKGWKRGQDCKQDKYLLTEVFKATHPKFKDNGWYVSNQDLNPMSTLPEVALETPQ